MKTKVPPICLLMTKGDGTEPEKKPKIIRSQKRGSIWCHCCSTYGKLYTRKKLRQYDANQVIVVYWFM